MIEFPCIYWVFQLFRKFDFRYFLINTFYLFLVFSTHLKKSWVFFQKINFLHFTFRIYFSNKKRGRNVVLFAHIILFCLIFCTFLFPKWLFRAKYHLMAVHFLFSFSLLLSLHPSTHRSKLQALFQN